MGEGEMMCTRLPISTPLTRERTRWGQGVMSMVNQWLEHGPIRFFKQGHVAFHPHWAAGQSGARFDLTSPLSEWFRRMKMLRWWMGSSMMCTCSGQKRTLEFIHLFSQSSIYGKINSYREVIFTRYFMYNSGEKRVLVLLVLLSLGLCLIKMYNDVLFYKLE